MAEPKISKRRNWPQPTRELPASATARVLIPGMNFDASRNRTPYRTKPFSVWRTQESGSSAMRQMNPRILAPRLLPIWNHAPSAIRQARTPKKRIGIALRWPALARAPQTSSRGADGSGKAASSARIQKNKTAYPCRITNSAVSFTRFSDSIQRLRIHLCFR